MRSHVLGASDCVQACYPSLGILLSVHEHYHGSSKTVSCFHQHSYRAEIGVALRTYSEPGCVGEFLTKSEECWTVSAMNWNCLQHSTLNFLSTSEAWPPKVPY